MVDGDTKPDITQIPLAELLQGRVACLIDIQLCAVALVRAFLPLNAAAIRHRKSTNEKIVHIIDAELERRKWHTS